MPSEIQRLVFASLATPLARRLGQQTERAGLVQGTVSQKTPRPLMATLAMPKRGLRASLGLILRSPPDKALPIRVSDEHFAGPVAIVRVGCCRVFCGDWCRACF